MFTTVLINSLDVRLKINITGYLLWISDVTQYLLYIFIAINVQIVINLHNLPYISAKFRNKIFENVDRITIINM